MCKEYQGWSNYPTWAVSLWINNEEGSYNRCNNMAEELANTWGKDTTRTRDKLVEWLKVEILDYAPELEGMYQDIFQWALDNVDWHEIAEGMLEDVEVETEDNDADDDDDDDTKCICGHWHSNHSDEQGCLHYVGKGEFCPCDKFTASDDDAVDTNGNHDMTCDQCNASMINGVYCHELGCPNDGRVKINDEWVTEDELESELDEEEFYQAEEDN